MTQFDDKNFHVDSPLMLAFKIGGTSLLAGGTITMLIVKLFGWV